MTLLEIISGEEPKNTAHGVELNNQSEIHTTVLKKIYIEVRKYHSN